MKYEDTHPWIQFSLNVDVNDFRLWLKLGEITSKCEHLSGVPLRPEFAQRLNQVFLAKGVLATTAIEGNTLSEEQVQEFLEGNLKLPPSQEYLKQEIENIITVCNSEVQAQINSTEEKVQLCRGLIESYKNVGVDCRLNRAGTRGGCGSRRVKTSLRGSWKCVQRGSCRGL